MFVRSSAVGRQAVSGFSLGGRGKVPVGAEGVVLLHASSVTDGPGTQVVGVVKS